MIRVILPFHLRSLANIQGEVCLDLKSCPTQRTLLDELERLYPMLCGTIRDHQTKQRRPYLRFFACQEDCSLLSSDAPLPEAVVLGQEPFMIVGSVAGG